MNKKLTLLLDETVIDQAKDYAKKQNETLSGMVEKYFAFITTKNPKKTSVKASPEVEKLSGIISIPDDLDIKEDYRKNRSYRVLNE